MGKSVKDAMTTSPATATPSQSLAEAARLMKQQDIGSVPVVDGSRLGGLLTDRHIGGPAVAQGGDPQTRPGGEIAPHAACTRRPGANPDDRLRLMAQHH